MPTKPLRYPRCATLVTTFMGTLITSVKLKVRTYSLTAVGKILPNRLVTGRLPTSEILKL